MGDNDYEGGRWIGDEFFYEKDKVKKRKFTKEDALYGIFAEDNSSDDGGGGGKKSRGGPTDKNLTRPVAFVATGKILQGGKKSDDEREDEEDEDEYNDFPSRGGLGSKKEKKKKTKKKTKKESVEPDLPMQFGSSKDKKRYDPFIGGQQIEQEPEVEMRPFEQFTKGIGSKLLAKMGYKGGGLGANGQGIVEPVAVKLRPKGLGLGNMDEKTDQQKAHERQMKQAQEAKEVTEYSGSEESSSDEDKPKSWKKGAQKRKSKTVYEVLHKDEEDRPQKILDMRGPQPKVVTSAAEVAAHKKAAGPLPELRYNLRLLVDLAEAKIQSVDRREKQEKDNLSVLTSEKARMEEQVRAEASRIERLQKVQEIIVKCQDRIRSNDMSLDMLKKIFEMLKIKYKEEYVMHNLKYVALELAGPLLRQHMAGWDPEVSPDYGVEIFEQWREILGDTAEYDEDEEDESFDLDAKYTRNNNNNNQLSVYTLLLMDTFMAKLRPWMSNQWNVRNYEPALQIIGAWSKVLPPSLTENILDQLVMPKLTRAVDAWDPRTDATAIHLWIHPWLPLLACKMDTLLFSIIRSKLSSALRDWNALDPSAHAILSPWANVFDPASMEALLVRSVLPKLILCLREFVVNPLQQYIEPFQSVMVWADIVPIHHFVSLLESEFFVKWLSVLYAWLGSRPDYDEVSRWYLGWKSFFPPHIFSQDRIRGYFNLALEAMNQAVTGDFNPNTFVPPPAPQTVPPPPPPSSISSSLSSSSIPSSVDDIDLKQVVEDLAVENNLSFLPSRKRHESGAQIYSFGRVPVYLEKGKVWVQEGTIWRSISPDALIARANAER